MDGPIRIRQLEALNALCEQGSMTKAAQALKISQPAVSRLLSDLAGDPSNRSFRISCHWCVRHTGTLRF